MEITAEAVAGLLARLLGEGHGLGVRQEGAVVHLPEHGMRVAVGTPDPQPHGHSIRVPIGVAHERWGEFYAWDQAVGIAGQDRHPVAEAVDGWTHNVFSVFAAMAIPKSDLVERVSVDMISDGSRTADVFYGPLAIRDFGGLSDDDKQAVVDRPPTMRLVEELFNGYALPDRPIWFYTFCANMPDGPITEVVLLNDNASDGFAHIADHLSWQGYGSVKSWALVVPR